MSAGLILNSSSTVAGGWKNTFGYQAPFGFTALQTGSSVGVTVTSTVNIEYSADGVNALATKPGSIAFNGASPQCDGFTAPSSMGGVWPYVRATVASISTGAVQVFIHGAPKS